MKRIKILLSLCILLLFVIMTATACYHKNIELVGQGILADIQYHPGFLNSVVVVILDNSVYFIDNTRYPFEADNDIKLGDYYYLYHEIGSGGTTLDDPYILTQDYLKNPNREGK